MPCFLLEEDNAEYLELLKATKNNYNLTLTQIAEKLNVNVSTVSRWMSGHINKMNMESRARMDAFFEEIWIHGLICYAPWQIKMEPMFFSVKDIKNPIDTYAIKNTCFDNSDYLEKLTECEKQLALGNTKKYLVKRYNTEIETLEPGHFEELGYTFGHAFNLPEGACPPVISPWPITCHRYDISKNTPFIG